MITLILCLRPLRVPKFIWFKILRDRRFEFGPEMCRGDTPEAIFTGACRANNIKLLKTVKPPFLFYTTQILKNACKSGFTAIVEYLRSFTTYMPTIKMASYWAAQGGHEHLFEIIGSLHGVLTGACSAGNLELVKKYAELGLRKKHYKAACGSGNMELIKYLISHNADWAQYGLPEACKNNRVEAVEFLLPFSIKMPLALYYSCSGGHLELVKLLVSKGAPVTQNNLIIASKHGRVEVMEYLLERGAVYCPEALGEACANNSVRSLNFWLCKGIILTKQDFRHACFFGCVDSAKFIYKNAVISKKLLTKLALDGDMDTSIVRFLVKCMN